MLNATSHSKVVEMPQPRTIKDYFKRPAFVQSPKSSFHDNIPAPSQPSSSPLSDPPSDLPSQLVSSQQIPCSSLEPQLDEFVLDAPNGSNHLIPSRSNHTNDATLHPSSSFGGNFNSSQRIVKNGKEIVVDSDAESADSISSLESPEDLLNKFLSTSSSANKKRDSKPPVGDSDSSTRSRISRFKDPRNRTSIVNLKEKKYKFSMESLVTRSVDDTEAEAGVAKAKAQLENHENRIVNSSDSPENQHDVLGLREDALVSAFAEERESTDLERLLNAVRRTEAFELEKSWSFFEKSSKIEIPDFPRDSILPSSREAFLREPASRDRAFHSGILDFALARGLLPDEVILWILQSVPVEPRDDLRYAYCRSLKHSSRERIEWLIQPEDIEAVFRSLGGTPTALNVSELVTPQNSYNQENSFRDWKYLLSVLELLRDIADDIRKDTRQHTLHILFRLALDTSVTRNSMVCSSLETTIDSVLQGIPQESFEELVRPIADFAFQTIKDVNLQSQLLRRILPTNPEISLFRARLAVCFLLNDKSVLEESAAEVLNLKRIAHHLQDGRFDAKLLKAKTASNYDYAELNATTSLLNIVIDIGRTSAVFSSKEAERQFNADVDVVAERVKRIFSAIEDSGASHLKRTEAKQSLEALHYRIVFSVRSKPRPKSIFGLDGSNESSNVKSSKFMERWATSNEKFDANDTEPQNNT